jgi:hypothetical protein
MKISELEREAEKHRSKKTEHELYEHLKQYAGLKESVGQEEYKDKINKILKIVKI